LRDAGKRLKSGVIMEGLGLLQASADDYAAALASYKLAREYYGATEDAMRVAVHEVFILRGEGRHIEAMTIAHGAANAVPKSPAGDMLKQLAAPPAPPAPPTPPAAPVGQKK
jgi:hypothetical protein